MKASSSCFFFSTTDEESTLLAPVGLCRLVPALESDRPVGVFPSVNPRVSCAEENAFHAPWCIRLVWIPLVGEKLAVGNNFFEPKSCRPGQLFVKTKDGRDEKRRWASLYTPEQFWISIRLAQLPVLSLCLSMPRDQTTLLHRPTNIHSRALNTFSLSTTIRR